MTLPADPAGRWSSADDSLTLMPSDAIVPAAGVELAVRDYGGPPEGRALVLLHGLSSNVCIWDHVGPRLAPSFRVVGYDQRSHGLSADGDGDFGFPALVRDLEAVIADRGLDEPLVVGHSWGAGVALAYAASHPRCPGVVCIDGGVLDLQGMGASWEQTEELLRPPRLIGPREKVLERIRREQAVLPWEGVLEPVVLRSRVTDPDGLTRPRLRLEDHMKIVRELWEQRTWDLYERIACPVMIVLARGVERNNREQGFVAIKQLASEQLTGRHPTVRVEWLESVHDIPLAHSDELARLVEEFVATL